MSNISGEENPSKCPHCDYKEKDQTVLTEHIMRIHPETLPPGVVLDEDEDEGSPSQPPAQTQKAPLVPWEIRMQKQYLVFGNSILLNEDADLITSKNWWFTNDVVDMAFDFLDVIATAADHRIRILSTAEAESLYKITANVHSENDAEFESGYPRHKELLGHIIDKDFIFVPVSDGFPAFKKGAKVDNRVGGFNAGMHWFLLAVDCRDRNNPQFRYFDSIARQEKNYDIALHTAEALANMLKHLERIDKGAQIKLEHDLNMPNQANNNSCPPPVEGGSACGPYLWAIVKELVLYIVESNEDGMDIGKLELTEGFRDICNWNSMQFRQDIRRLFETEVNARLALYKEKDRMTIYLDIDPNFSGCAILDMWAAADKS